MQVSFNNLKINHFYPISKTTTMPDKNLSFTNSMELAFQAAPITKPVMSTKIYNEKARMLKKLNEILKTNVPVLDKEQLWEIIESRATAIIKMKNRKRISYESELESIYNSPYLSSQQKYNRICEIEKEEKELEKIDPFEIPDYLIPKETKESYDYKLIEKFKLALNDNNFDLRTIFQEHYKGLEDIKTVSELKERYPSITIPPSFKDVIADKIIKTFPRNTYEELDKIIRNGNGNEEEISQFIRDNFAKKVILALVEFGIVDKDSMHDTLMILSERFAKNCAKIVSENRLSAISAE